MWPNPQETKDLVVFTEKMLHGKLHFCVVFETGDKPEKIEISLKYLEPITRILFST